MIQPIFYLPAALSGHLQKALLSIQPYIFEKLKRICGGANNIKKMANIKLLLFCVLLQLVLSCKTGCASCDSSQSTCYQCQDPSTQPMFDGTCTSVSIAINNCVAYGLGAVCTKCIANYKLNAGACVQDLTGCLLFAQDGTCINCGFGTFPSNGGCVGVLNCEVYVPNNINMCMSCLSGYTAISGSCYWLDGCNGVPSQGICQSCLPEYTYSGYSCIKGKPNIRGCAVYSASGNCLFCKDGFALSNGQCSFQGVMSVSTTTSTVAAGQTGSSIINPSQSGNTVTITTVNSSQVSVNNNPTVVTSTPTGSQTFSSTSSTSSQFTSNGLSGSASTNDFAGNGSTTSGTFTSSGSPSETTVTSTSTTFASSSSTLPPNCQFTSDNGKCIRCLVGYYVNNATAQCVQVSSLCGGAYNPITGACLQCISGYTLVSGNCVQNAPTDPNCRIPAPDGCLSCNQGYYKANGTCKEVSKLCNGYDLQTGLCFACVNGYQNNNGVCVQITTGQASQATNGITTVSSMTTTVVTIDVNCASSQGNVCNACNQGYSLNGNQCIQVQNPDPYCLRYANFSCIACVNNYVLSANSTCTIQYCQTMLQNGTCGQCISGYNLTNQGTACVRVTTISNCDTVSNGVCVKCSNGYYLNNSGQCAPTRANCAVYNPNNGLCITCPPLYNLAPDSYCMESVCRISNGGVCIQCAQAYYLDTVTFGCRQITISNCNSVINGTCTSCNSGYVLVNGACVLSAANCIQYSSTGCVACLTNFQFFNGNCFPVPPNCLTIGANGVCVTCISGFSISQNGGFGGTQCVQTPQLTQSFPNCLTPGPIGCSVCSNRFWLTQGGSCQQVNSQCKEYNSSNGYCTSCYDGYALNTFTGQCRLLVKTDSSCQTYGSDGACTKCYPSYFLNTSKVCVSINPVCFTYDSNTGLCTSCYQGWTLRNGNCSVRISDPNCNSFNANGSCRECSKSYYFSNGKCVRQNPVCFTVDQNTGSCLSCYEGWVLVNGNCSVGTTAQLANCKTSFNGTCQVCSTGYYRAANQTCVQISPLCATADQNNGQCLSCYQGFALSQGTCIVTSGIANCKQYFNNSTCSQCSNGYYLRSGNCYEISALCKTADQTNGACTSCYQGYALQSGTCAVTTATSNCRQWTGTQCLECSQGYLKTSSGGCVEINPSCRTFDNSNGNCVSCYQGYVLVNGNCQVPTNNDPNCIQKSGVQCLYCANGYWLADNVCLRLTKACATYDQRTGFCLTCSSSYRFSNGDCVSSPVSSDQFCVSSDGSGRCTGCIQSYFLKSGVCTMVSLLCIEFDYGAGVCKICNDGFVLQDGDCINPAMGVDENCVRYTGVYCSTCRQGYQLIMYRCSTVDTNCLEFDNGNMRCLRCRVGTPLGMACIT